MDEDLVLGLFLLLVLLSGGSLVLLARRLRARGGRAGWPQVLLGNLLVLLVLLSLGLLGGELYYRFLYDATDSLDYTKVSVRWFQRHYHMNPAGCRDNVNYAAAIQPGNPSGSLVDQIPHLGVRHSWPKHILGLAHKLICPSRQ